MERILVVDDEEGIAGIVKAYFEKEGWTVDLASTGLQALSLFEQSLVGPSISSSPFETGMQYSQRQYSLAVLDLMLPDLSGVELCRRFRARSSIAIIMLTARVGPDAAAAGLDAGADDYLEKPFSPRELLARARAVLRRAVPSGSPAASIASDGVCGTMGIGDLQIDRDARQVRKAGHRLELTATEWRILDLLAARPGRIFTRAEIVDRALGEDYDGYDRTVDVHIRNLRKKIETDPGSPELVETVRGLGYRLGICQ
jgi:DNA-binding response OmpR family regulator